MARHLVLIVVSTLAVGCSSLDVDAIPYACDDDGACGAGWRCARGAGQVTGVCEPLTVVDTSTKSADVGWNSGDDAQSSADAADATEPGYAPDVAPVCVPEACDDDNPCTYDGCEGGVCAHAALPGLCEDGDLCTTGDYCEARVCIPGEPVVCDDGDACTGDACLPELGCQYTPIRGCSR